MEGKEQYKTIGNKKPKEGKEEEGKNTPPKIQKKPRAAKIR